MHNSRCHCLLFKRCVVIISHNACGFVFGLDKQKATFRINTKNNKYKMEKELNNDKKAESKAAVSKSVLCSIYENIEYYKEYLKLRIDIIANEPTRWLGNSKMELPTFEYYLKNCVKDTGGKYDFTVRRYSTPAQSLEPISFHSQNKYAMNSKRLYRYIIHSYWMGTPFNYETVIKTVC